MRLFNRNIANSGAVTSSGVNPSCGVFGLDTTAVIANGNWYFVAAVVHTSASTVTLYVLSSAGTLLAATSSAYAGTWQTGSGLTAIGGYTSASPYGQNTAFHFKGKIDEVQIYASALSQTVVQGLLSNVRPCAITGPDHYELALPTASLACVASTVTVTACANTSSPCTSAATTVGGATATLGTSGATPGATSITFNSSGIATTTLSYPTASNGTTAPVMLSGESTVAINARLCCPDGISCLTASSCSSTFKTAGFIVSASAGGSTATLPAQTAGSGSGSYVLRGVKTSTTTLACEAALTGTANVNWSATCNNPSTCSVGNLMTVTGNAAVAVAGNANGSSASSTAVGMTFDANGNAPFSFNYADVGQVTLTASRAASGSLLTALSGSSNAFVVKPGGFVVSGLKQTAAPQPVNPAAGSAAGSKFVKAGESFSASVTAQTSGGATTPNYGRETSPEGVLLTRALVLPSGGASGTLSNGSIAGGSFSAGVATVTNLAFSEVGIITLSPAVADGDYLGAGNVTGTTSGNIGRFVPAQFALSGGSVSHRTGLSCSPASAFSYLGENFRLGFTLTAQNTAGATTTNYSSTYAKLEPTSAGAWNLAGLSGTTTFSVASGRLSLGSATGSFASGVASGIMLTANASRAALPDGPFSTVFGVAPADSDGVAMAAYDLASTPGGGNDRTSVATVPLRFGRLRLSNAMGAADRALSLPATVQAWTGTAWDTNTLGQLHQRGHRGGQLRQPEEVDGAGRHGGQRRYQLRQRAGHAQAGGADQRPLGHGGCGAQPGQQQHRRVLPADLDADQGGHRGGQPGPPARRLVRHHLRQGRGGAGQFRAATDAGQPDLPTREFLTRLPGRLAYKIRNARYMRGHTGDGPGPAPPSMDRPSHADSHARLLADPPAASGLPAGENMKLRWPWRREKNPDRLVVCSTADRCAYALADRAGRLIRCGLLQRQPATAQGQPEESPQDFARRLRALALPGADAWAVLSLEQAQLVSVDAPAVRPEEMKAAARWRIKDLIEGRLDEMTIDVMFVGDEQPRPNRQVFAAAAPTEAILALLDRTRSAGLTLAVIDMVETAQRNLQTALAEADNLRPRATAALVQYGSQCLLTICAGGELYYARRLAWDDLPARRAPAPAAVPAALTVAAGLEMQDFVDYGDEAALGSAPGAEAPRLVVELQRSFDVWERSWPDLPLAALWVSAGEASADLAALLQTALGQQVRMLNTERLFPGFRAAAADPKTRAAVLPLLGALLRSVTRRA